MAVPARGSPRSEAGTPPRAAARSRRSWHTGRSSWRASTTAGRSGSTASGSRTSPRIRRSRTVARMLARLYDALARGSRDGQATCSPSRPSGAASRTGISARRERAEEQVAGRDAIAAWAGVTYGWLGRSPDYKAAFLGDPRAPTPSSTRPTRTNARRWYRYQPGARARSSTTRSSIRRSTATWRPARPGGPTDVYAHVTKETDAGIHVTGAKVVATGSALTHFTFVAHHGLIPVQGKNFAVVFMVPTNAKGVKLICRVSNEQRAAVLGSPFDYPLSSRLDENDAIFVMDDVFVPWEDVFVYADVEKANNFFPADAASCRAR